MIYNQVNPTKTREYPAIIRLFEKRVYFGSQNATADDVYQVLSVLANDVVLAAWVDVETACTTGATISLGHGNDINYFGNKMLVDSVGKCDTVLNGTLTWDSYLVYDKSSHTNEIEITGARYGDHVTVSSGMDCADMSLNGEVMHEDWVAVHLYNNTGGGLDLAEQDIDVCVNKAPRMANPWVVSAGDTIDVKANDAITAGIIKVSALIIRK